MWRRLPQFREDIWPTLLINISWLIVTKCHPYIQLHFNRTLANTNNIPRDRRFIEASLHLWEGKKKKRGGGRQQYWLQQCFQSRNETVVRFLHPEHLVFRIGLKAVWWLQQEPPPAPTLPPPAPTLPPPPSPSPSLIRWGTRVNHYWWQFHFSPSNYLFLPMWHFLEKFVE